MNYGCKEAMFIHTYVPSDYRMKACFDGLLHETDIEKWGFDEKDVYLYLMNRNIMRIMNCHIFDRFQSCQELNLSGNLLDSIDHRWFLHLENLVSLDLSNNNIGKLPDFSFKNLAKLEVLNLDNNKLKAIAKFTLSGLKNLKRLSAKNNLIENVYAKLFVDLKNVEIEETSNWKQSKGELHEFENNPTRFFILKRIICLAQ